jgi:hypothetical protein
MQHEATLNAVLTHAQLAMKDVQDAKDQLCEADLQAGRAWYIIKKSGFPDIFGQWNSVRIKLTQSNGASLHY